MDTNTHESAIIRLPVGTMVRGIIVVGGKRYAAEITIGIDTPYGTPEDHLLYVQQICRDEADRSAGNPASEVILSDVSQPQMVETAKIVHGTHFSIHELPGEQPQQAESRRLLDLIKSAITGILARYGRS